MTARVLVRAQAKINLWLRVLHREPSGYHAIETMFHRIELSDDLVVAVAESGERTVSCTVDVGPMERNLAYRAAELYRQRQSWPAAYRIDITKRIPAAGGLGGGSADAAATLRALNSVSPHKLETAALEEMAASLGADVPFLVSDAVAAIGRGHGDVLQPLPALPQRHVALVVPPFGIATADAYATVAVQSRGAESVAESVASGAAHWAAVRLAGGNDLATAGAARAEPGLDSAVESLRRCGAAVAGMTGSGSVLFGIFEAEPDVAALRQATGWQVLLTRTAVNVDAPRRLD